MGSRACGRSVCKSLCKAAAELATGLKGGSFHSTPPSSGTTKATSGCEAVFRRGGSHRHACGSSEVWKGQTLR